MRRHVGTQLDRAFMNMPYILREALKLKIGEYMIVLIRVGESGHQFPIKRIEEDLFFCTDQNYDVFFLRGVINYFSENNVMLLYVPTECEYAGAEYSCARHCGTVLREDLL